jgi:hypothetical protein
MMCSRGRDSENIPGNSFPIPDIFVEYLHNNF